MDQYGETDTIYVWPKNHEPGEPYPEDFYDKLRIALDGTGIDWETV